MVKCRTYLSDNLQLSNSPTCNRLHAETSPDPLVAEYLLAARADNTNRAYDADLRHFRAWGGHLPSDPDEIVRYLAQHAGVLRPGTLYRRLAALATAHHDRGLPDPTKHPLVRRVMHGISRRHFCAPARVAPLLIDDLARIVAGLGHSRMDFRDRALLLAGFFGALRRSELVALDCEPIERTGSGLLLNIAKSKTDQTGKGRLVHLARRADMLCPVRAVGDWLAVAGLTNGALFREADGKELGARLSGWAVARIVKAQVQHAGFDPAKYSGHSLRAGFATSAAMAGFDALVIARQTGHRSNRALSAYVRPQAVSLALIGSPSSPNAQARSSGTHSF